MKRIAVGRIVGTGIAVLGLLLGTYFGWEAWQLDARLDVWMSEPLFATEVDLSTPGSVELPYYQDCYIAHGVMVCLDCDVDNEAKHDFPQLFEGFAGTITVNDESGEKLESLGVAREYIQCWDGEFVLAYLPLHDNQECVATLRVDSGASQLSGVKQTVYVQYELGGLERLAVKFEYGVAAVAGLVGLVSLACVLPGFWRHGVWIHEPPIEPPRLQ